MNAYLQWACNHYVHFINLEVIISHKQVSITHTDVEIKRRDFKGVSEI